jgi:hypothetical protein
MRIGFEKTLAMALQAQEQFETLSKTAEQAGVKVELSHLKLAEASALVEEKLSQLAGLQTDIAGVSKEIETLVIGMRDVISPETSFDAARPSIGRFRSDMKALAGDVADLRRNLGTMTAEEVEESRGKVVESYRKIYEGSAEYLEELKQEWTDLGDHVEEIQNRIAELSQTAEEYVRELRRKTMTEEQVWQDTRLEYEETYSAAVQAYRKGEFEAAADLFAKARDLAKSLSQEVKSESGETVQSLAETTSLAIDLVRKATDGAQTSLIDYQASLEDQQKRTQKEIGKTTDNLEALREMIDGISQMSLHDITIRFLGQASPVRPLMETLDAVQGKMKSVFDGMPKETSSKVKFDLPQIPEMDRILNGNTANLYSPTSPGGKNQTEKTVRMKFDFGSKVIDGMFTESAADMIVKEFEKAQLRAN